MALTPVAIYGAFVTCRAMGGFPFAGVNFDRAALGIANGVCQWALSQPANLALTGAATGLMGVGVINPVTTKLLVPPDFVVVSGAIVGAGLAGPLGQSFAIVTAQAISQAFSTVGQYYGTAPTVGVGADVSKIAVSNPATLIAMLMQSLAGTLGVGPLMPMLATGLGNGIAALLLTGTGTGSVNGPSVPGTGAGPTVSVVV